MNEFLEDPFRNPGAKIKAVAPILLKILIFLDVITGIVAFITAMSVGIQGFLWGTLYGVLICVVGAFSSWLLSLLIYAFGQLVENSAMTDDEKQAAREADEVAEEKALYSKEEPNSEIFRKWAGLFAFAALVALVVCFAKCIL